MDTLWTILIVVACIWAMLISMGVLLARLRNRTSTPPSPTPSTTPTPTSDETVLKLMTALNQTWTEQMKETRQMVSDLTLGRESQRPTGTPETWPTPNERPLDFDYDSIPLSPGIEAVLEREEQESTQERLRRERQELQEQLIEKQAEMDRATLEQSSQGGPWSNGSSPKHAVSED